MMLLLKKWHYMIYSGGQNDIQWCVFVKNKKNNAPLGHIEPLKDLTLDHK